MPSHLLPGSAVLAVALAQAGTPSFPSDTPEGPEVVVNARVPHCHPRPDDPADAATAAAPTQYWYRLIAQPDGRFTYEKSVGAETWPTRAIGTQVGHWRRAGDAMPSFTFRTPEDGTPLCVGRTPGGTIQLQQLLDPAPFRCEYIRFTAWAASGKAAAAFWINAGAGGPAMVDFSGNHDWTPVKDEGGPVASWDLLLGFGLIARGGDVWLYQPSVAVIPDTELTHRDRVRQVECRARQARLNRLTLEHPGAVAQATGKAD